MRLLCCASDCSQLQAGTSPAAAKDSIKMAMMRSMSIVHSRLQYIQAVPGELCSFAVCVAMICQQIQHACAYMHADAEDNARKHPDLSKL